MDLFPLWNSLRVAAISTVIVFFAGIFAAYYIALSLIHISEPTRP